MKKILNILSISILCCGISSVANGEILEKGSKKIYTEDFTVLTESNESNDGEILGKVGTLEIKSGTRSDKYVAFVKEEVSRKNYLIGSAIYVECTKGIDCVTEKYNGTKLGKSDLYIVKANNYEEWERYVTELKTVENVVAVAPSYEYGRKLQLR